MSPALLLATLLAQHEHHQAAPSLAATESSRIGSGTAWQPGGMTYPGWHVGEGPWRLMLHGVLIGGYDWQAGPRGGKAALGLGWLMAMGQRDWSHGVLQLRAMLSPEPWTVRDGGYPLLLQTGETHEGQPLHDRQHPHDLFMELAALVTQDVGPIALQGYAALAGEPALGPVAFPHRSSAMGDPLAPLGHHWLDSTHISFGVLTLGVVGRRAKLEGSWFNGREPDEQRWDLDLRAPDSYAARLWLGLAEGLMAQVSYGHLSSPEPAEPGPLDRFTASLAHRVAFAGAGQAATLLAAGANRRDGATWAVLAESTIDLDGANVAFARLEYVQKTGEELGLPTDTRAHAVQNVVLGYLRDFGATAGLRPGLGVRLAGTHVPSALALAYGDRSFPLGALVYVRLLPAPPHRHHE